jgi:Tol biopolymer transport system component
MGKRGRGVGHSLLLALLVVAGCGGSDEERPLLAFGIEGEALYVVVGDEVEGRGPGVQPAWSPDGRLAFVRDGDVFVEDRRVGPGDFPQWTPDGRSLVVERDGIRLLNVESAEERLLARGTVPALSPDGDTVAFVRGASLHTVSVDGAMPRRWAGLADPAVSLRWLSESSEVAVLEQDPLTGATRIERVAADGEKQVIARQVGEHFDTSPDGSRIAFTPTQEIGLSIARADGTDVKQYPLVDYGPGTPMNLKWSPDGREIAFSVGEQDELGANFVSIYALDVEEGDVRQLARASGIGADIAWYPSQP